MRVMRAGDGYTCLPQGDAARANDLALSTPLTRYSTEAQDPPEPELEWFGLVDAARQLVAAGVTTVIEG